MNKGNKHDNWCLFRYYVGVLNKRTMQMEVHNAQLFNMQPVIPGKKNKSPVCTAYNVLAYHKLMIAILNN